MTASSDPQAPSRSWKETLNLPKTPFPMRANLVQNEPASRKRWDAIGLYDLLRKRQSPNGTWNFHDGPPYANASIHIGHLLNKVLKDLVVRTRSVMGYDVAFVPGWDCHGLPIEHLVMTDLVNSGKMNKLKDLPEETYRMAVRRECRAHAEKHVKLQAEQMQRLHTLADYAHPYMTMAPEFEAGTLEVFALMVRNGLVYRDLKPVHWSIENQTALAEAELEYYDRTDPSVYVCFDVADPAALARAFGVKAADVGESPALLIWTTTPWTLPANLAIAVHERFTYALVRLGDRCVIVAEDLVAEVAKVAGGAKAQVLGTCAGADLLGLTYRHPFLEQVSPVVSADYVTLEDGTGLVHTAPGHGADDYHTGMKHGLAIYCPVREDGTYDDSVPPWLRGLSIWEANKLIMARLRESGHLLHSHDFVHSYPHDWRGKSPVIFRATEQWFVRIDDPTHNLREKALAAVGSGVSFVPDWGRNRMRGMLESRPDWCLSRQRAWGLPIPAFFDAADLEAKRYLLTEHSVMAVAYNIQKHGSDYWFTATPEQLLDGYDAANDPDCPEWYTPGSALRKSRDIFDVWFESGSSWNPVLRGRGLGFPADLYLEGSDQHRGWFQASLLCALGSVGTAPYRELLTHGFLVDKDGRKMSKSLGNALQVETLLKDHGADVCRWWVASLNYENDIKVDPEFFALAGESYRKVRNTLRFLLSNLYDFDPAQHALNVADLPSTSLEAWVLGELNDLQQTVVSAWTTYQFRAAHAAIFNFCNDTLSAIYCAAVKDRLYCDAPDSVRRRRAQTAMYHLAEALCRILAPLIPHTADEAWRALHNLGPKDEPQRCIHLEMLIDPLPVSTDSRFGEIMERRDAALRVLEQARAAGTVENPLDAEVHVADADGLLAAIARETMAHREDFTTDFADLLGASRVSFVPPGQEKVVPLLDQPRCDRSWKRDATVKPRSDGSTLSDRDAAAVGIR